MSKKASFFCMFFLLISQSLFGFFDRIIGTTLTLNLTLNVTGQAMIIPFIVFPDGTTYVFESQIIQDSSYSIPPYVNPDPMLGIYNIGTVVIGIANNATTNSIIVAFDLNNTSILRQDSIHPDATYYFRPTEPNHYSVTLQPGDNTGIPASIPYMGL